VGGLILGVVADIGPHLDERLVALEPGDQLLLYTDGVTEATDPEQRQFGLEALSELLALRGHLPPAELIAAILRALEGHAREAEQHDDITLIAIRRAAGGTPRAG
jgi:sigma-B regulation protein RsbU (phosphoserine phosphatase)